MSKDRLPSAPKKDASFKKYWKKFIASIYYRENCNDIHLKNLEILCQCYVEYDELTLKIKEKGFSYEAIGRYGVQKKTIPEVLERQKLLAEIRAYGKQLGVTPGKPKPPKKKSVFDE